MVEKLPGVLPGASFGDVGCNGHRGAVQLSCQSVCLVFRKPWRRTIALDGHIHCSLPHGKIAIASYPRVWRRVCPGRFVVWHGFQLLKAYWLVVEGVRITRWGCPVHRQGATAV